MSFDSSFLNTEKSDGGRAWRIEALGGGVSAVVSREHNFGTDALLLAYFAEPKNIDRVCDLGTGCGIIPLYWRSRGVTAYIAAVEIQESAYAQVCEANRINPPDKSVVPVLADLRNLKGILPFGEFDLVTMNPPYFKGGIMSVDKERMTARHDLECTLDDVCRAAASLLRFGGRFCMCLPPERLCDAVELMRKYSLEPKRLRFAKYKEGDKPYLMLIEGRRGGKPSLAVLPDIVLTENGKGESKEMKEVLSEYLKMKACNTSGRKENER